MPNFIKNTIFYSIGEILPRVISFFLLPVYTRYLSPADYGISSYTHTFVLFLFVLGAFALNSYVLRYYFIHEDEEDRRILIGTVQLAILFMNCVILALAFLFMPLIIDHYDIQVPWDPYFRLAFIINFLDCLSIIPMVIYRVRQEAFKFVCLGLVRTILTVLVTIYLVVYLQRGLIGIFQAQLYVLLPYSLVYLYIMQKYGRWRFNWDYFKEGLRYSAPLIPGSICYLLLSVSDRIILERNVEMGELGIYNVACQLSLVLNIVINSGYKAIEPELFLRYGKDGFYDFIHKTQSVFFCAIYLTAIILCLYSQEVFILLTSEAFHEGYLLVPALVIGVIMTGQNVIYGGILQGERRTKLQGTATIIGALVSIVINLTLIPFFGTYAAAAASAISFFVMNVLLFCAMTFPGKTMWRETLLVILIPLISYMFFFTMADISVLNIFLKTMIVILYAILCIKLLRIDVAHAKVLFLKKGFDKNGCS